MFNKFTVITKTINMSNGENVTWVNKDTEKEAMDKFYDECSTVGGNSQTKACEVIIVEPNGNIRRTEPIDNEKYVLNTKQIAIDNAIANYKANPTDENLAKIKEAVTAE